MDWAQFNRDAASRDELYIARDRSVNAIALPKVREQSMRRIVASMHSLSDFPKLQELLPPAIRPTRAIAFERLPQHEALRLHPELGDAYKVLGVVEQVMAPKFPAGTDAHAAAVAQVEKHLLQQLNAGEVRTFKALSQPSPAVRSAPAPSQGRSR